VLILEDLQLDGGTGGHHKRSTTAPRCGRRCATTNLRASSRSAATCPASDGWIKTMNRDHWRYEMEREGGFRSRRRRTFV
jgi:hypothetical protein